MGPFTIITLVTRLSYSGITPAFQAGDAGSTPVGRLGLALQDVELFFYPQTCRYIDKLSYLRVYLNKKQIKIFYIIQVRTQMGQRGEVYSTRLVKNDRTYFFNVKENVYGELYMNIVESKGDIDSNRFIRQSILIYQEDMGEFIREFQKSLDFIKIHGKEKRESRPSRYERTEAPVEDNE